MIKNNQNKPQIIISQPLGNAEKMHVRIENKNAWLTQKLITELFEVFNYSKFFNSLKR